VLIQRGDVTAASGSSITLRSADGFTKRYVVNASTKVGGASGDIGSVAAGDTAVVCAVAGSGGPTARNVILLAHK
jgi:hypothetical protein